MAMRISDDGMQRNDMLRLTVRCSWDELYSVAMVCQNPRLSLDCQWRLGLWDDLRHSLAHPNFQENTETSIVKAYSLIRSAPDVDNIDHQLQRIAQHIKDEWTMLPPHCINPKIAVLQRMHQMSEVDESFKIVSDIRRHSRDGIAVSPLFDPLLYLLVVEPRPFVSS
jgi:hypothetical protein